MGLGGGGAIPCPPEETDYQPLLLKVFLMQDPDCWSAIPVRTQRVMQLLTGTWQSHVSLQVLKNTRYTHSEKAGVGGSTPSLATVSSKLLAVMTTWQFMVCLFGIQYWP
jgi:hypothetical protein